MPKDLSGAPLLLKQLLEQMLSKRDSDKGKIVHLEEEKCCCVSVFSGASQNRHSIPRPSKWLY
jgi:hypothetical protein